MANTPGVPGCPRSRQHAVDVEFLVSQEELCEVGLHPEPAAEQHAADGEDQRVASRRVHQCRLGPGEHALVAASDDLTAPGDNVGAVARAPIAVRVDAADDGADPRLADQAGDLIEFTAQDVPVRVIPVGRPDGLRAGT